MPLEATFEALPDMAFRLDPDGTVVAVNAAAASGLATRRDGLLGRRIQDIGLCNGAEPFSAALLTLGAMAQTIAVEYGRGPPGESTHHEARLVPLPGGETLVLVRDITQRQRIENALRDSDANFRLLADNVTDAFWIRSADMQQVHYVSPGFQRIWGRPTPTLYSSPGKWVDFIHPQDREHVVHVFSGLTGERRSLDIEYRITRPDGETRWVRVRGFQVRDAADRLIRNTGIVTDVTEQRQAQAALDAAQSELRDASRRAGMAEIATNVLHNVGNILNSVTVSAGLVRSTLHKSRTRSLSRVVQLLNEHAADLGSFLALDDRGRMVSAHLEGISQALLQEQSEMAAELANLSRSIEHIQEVVATQQSYAGRPALLEPAAICELVEDALRINGDALLRGGVSVIRDFAPAPLARLDRPLVLQILVNLIANARQALEALPVASRQIVVRGGVARDGWLRVSVEDGGEGIPQDNLLRIFGHGFTTRPKGHGFGLHSCALAAAQMGGTLTAASEGPGRGATFTLELPLVPVQAAP